MRKYHDKQVPSKSTAGNHCSMTLTCVMKLKVPRILGSWILNYPLQNNSWSIKSSATFLLQWWGMTDIGCQQNLHPSTLMKQELVKNFDCKFDKKQTCSGFQRFHFFHDGSKVVENLVKSIRACWDLLNWIQILGLGSPAWFCLVIWNHKPITFHRWKRKLASNSQGEKWDLFRVASDQSSHPRLPKPLLFCWDLPAATVDEHSPSLLSFSACSSMTRHQHLLASTNCQAQVTQFPHHPATQRWIALQKWRIICSHGGFSIFLSSRCSNPHA